MSVIFIQAAKKSKPSFFLSSSVVLRDLYRGYMEKILGEIHVVSSAEKVGLIHV